MKRYILFVPVLLLLHSSLFGQAPVIQWQRTMGSTNGDYPHSIIPTSDGGYIVAGHTEGADGDVMGYHGNIIVGDIWVIKMDASGAVQWTRTLGGINQEVNGDIHQTPDGGYIIAASSWSMDCGITGNHGGLDFWLIKLKPNGDLEWQKMLGGSLHEYAWALSPTADGGYIIGGFTNSSDGQVTGYHGNFDWWVIKVDGSGNLVWEKTLGGSGDDQCLDVKATPDGGCIAVGNTSSSDGDVLGYHGGIADYWVVKFSSTGAVEWKKTLGGSGMEQAWSVQLTTDGGYIIAGVSSSNDGDVSGNHWSQGSFSDFWVVKLGSTGNIIWQKCYGGSLNEIAFSIENTADGGYVVTGSAGSSDGDLTCNNGQTDAWIIKIDATGNIQWTKTMGGSGPDEPHMIKTLPDGSFIMAAVTCSEDVPGYHTRGGTPGSCGDYWIVKLTAPQATPPAPIVTIGPADRIICPGSPATFTATLTNYPGAQASYHWTRNNLPVGTSSPTYTAADFNNNDIVAVLVTAGSGPCDITSAQATSSLTVSQVPNTTLNPEIKITASSTYLCDCAPVSFKATVTGGGRSPVYQWMINGTIAGNSGDTWLSANLKPTDIVTCQYSDLTGCVANAPLTSNPISLLPGTGAPATVSISGPADKPCAGSLVTFTASPVNAGANPIYQWKVNGIPTGTNSPSFSSPTLAAGDIITCTVTPDIISNTCTTVGDANSNPIVLTLADPSVPAVSVKISPPVTIICKDNSLSFAATTTNAGANPAYQWAVNGQPAGTNSPTFSGQNFADGDLVKCTVTVDPAWLCATTNTATSPPVILLVHDQLNPTVSITATGNGACSGSPIGFSVEAKDAGAGPSYQWLVNGAPPGDNTTSFSSAHLTNNDVVTCSLTPGPGACTLGPIVSNAIVALVRSLPQVGLTPPDTVILYDHQLQLNAAVSANVVSYEWSPADQFVSSGTLHPLTIPLEENTLFSLTVTTADGCKASSSAKVSIYRALAMPSAFSPNGDGVNDLFRIPPGITLQLKEFAVFDRWGMRVFTTHNIGTGWDGTVGGHPAEPGVYVYMITGTDIKGTVTAKGTVVLVR